MWQSQDWARVRADYPALANWTYLDTASFGQLPRVAVDAVTAHLAHRDKTASTQFLSWFEEMDIIREACAKLINATAKDIAFVHNASSGLGLLMQSLNWRPGDELLTLSDEFPNQLYQAAAATRCGATFRKVAWDDFYDAVNERTRVVALSTVNYASGFRPPIAEIGRILRERRVIFYLDGTQSVGALQMNVRTAKASMLCVDAYKWMLSPNGAGFVYVDPELRNQLAPTVIGWRSDAGWRDVHSLNHGSPVLTESAEKYEGGMLPFPSLYAMGAVINMMLEIGTEAIEGRILDLAAKVRSMLAECGAEVNADESQIVTAKLPQVDAAEAANFLKARKIAVSARHGRLRVSPHFYNNELDIQALRKALHNKY